MEINAQQSLLKPGLFEKFKAQTHRDFELAGASEFLPDIKSNNLLEIENEFIEALQKLEMRNLLKPLLYRIDITELQIKQACNKNKTATLQNLLAELMIKRILQKVVLKELYSK